MNSNGESSCICNHGFDDLSQNNDGRLCVDIDECTNGEAKCDVNAQCINTMGSYQCKCTGTYHGNGFECSNNDRRRLGLFIFLAFLMIKFMKF